MATKQDADFKKAPRRDAPSHGRLPKGTLVNELGKSFQGYVFVESDLEEGRLRGWLPFAAFSKSAPVELDAPPVVRPNRRNLPSAAYFVSKNAPLRKSPNNSAPVFGNLPAGTVLNVLNREVDEFQLVEVELEDGVQEGWLDKQFIDHRAPNTTAVDESSVPAAAEPVVPTTKQNRRKKIPLDEGVLFGREPSFFFGLRAGGNYTLLTPNNLNVVFDGLGFTGGVLAGTYLQREFPVGVELAYTMINANVAQTGATLAFGLLDVAVVPHYIIKDRFDFHVGVQYSFGLGLGDIPTAIFRQFGPADLSGVWFLGGAGYNFSIDANTELSAVARYSRSISATVFGFDVYSFCLVLRFKG